MDTLVADKDRLFDILRSGIDANDTANKCEQVLDELGNIERLVNWNVARYAYKGTDICRAIEEMLRPLIATCQHHKTFQRFDKLLLRAYKVSNIYHRAHCTLQPFLSGKLGFST